MISYLLFLLKTKKKRRETRSLMTQLLLKYANIALTTITIRPGVWASCPLLLVRLGGYIVNLCEFYSYSLIGKLTLFLHIQEFCQCNQIVDSSTTTVRFFFLSSNLGLEMFSPRLQLNLVFVCRCSSSTTNPVPVSRVDSSFLV